jgi:hypothetical protein
MTRTNGTHACIKDPEPVIFKKSSLANPKTLEDRVLYLYERQQITDLLNEYAYVLDVCMVDHSTIDRWVDLFTNDCNVTYPFGNHKGRAGLAEWAMNAETRFHRMLVSLGQ